ncbi:tumor necrosis factor receptor superfamily member 25-like [Scyliorhinus torazame]|uniref:tumor necrosis factor receptor superfamily member 25-like n=1 Tax=Scyliorhinus torazame TaxID=75743 RepID=UPI003B5B7527
MISASGSFSHWTTGVSWSRSPTEWNLTRIIRKDRQLGIWKDGVRRRGKRTSGICENNLYRDSQTSFCCKKCPAGSYVASSCKKNGELPVCEPCPKDTYLAFENYVSKCQSCTLCDKDFQISLRSCTATNNTVCGCHSYQYKKCHLPNCQSFYCEKCSECSHRQVIKMCSNMSNTQCGGCQTGYYQHGGQCKSCTEEPCKNSSSPNCSRCLTTEPLSGHTGLRPVLILAIVGSIFILLVLLQFLRQKFRRVRVPEKLEATTVTAPEEDKKIKNEDKTLPFEIPALDVKSDVIVEVLTQPLANSNIYGTSPQTTLLQHETRATSLEGKTLYEIINLVPVRRWKELMRVLQLRDCDIERIEMDVAQSRDQQYEMLRQWSQQCTASMESVYQALETMNLSGIVEELQIKLLNNANSLH